MRVEILNAMILATKLALISPVAHELVAQKFVAHGLMKLKLPEKLPRELPRKLPSSGWFRLSWHFTAFFVLSGFTPFGVPILAMSWNCDSYLHVDVDGSGFMPFVLGLRTCAAKTGALSCCG